MADGSNGVARDIESGLDAAAAANVVPIKDVAKGKLTGKQLAYVRAILKGMNQSDAYRVAYSAEKMSSQAIWTEAGRLFRHPEVSRRIMAGRAAQERQAVHSGASLRDDLIHKLHKMTTEAEKDSDRLRAMEILGKTEYVSLFLDRSTDVATENLTEDEIREQVVEKLRAAFGETG